MSDDTAAGVAQRAYRLGYTVVPPREDGSKQPEGQWGQWQESRPSREQMRAWYDAGRRSGVGLLTGDPELFEFDRYRTYETFLDTAEGIGLGELIARIRAGYEERTPGGGIHWFYRCSERSGNTTLARFVGDDGKPKALIQTRGEGGYAVLAPSNGKVHPSGGRYELVSGSIETIAEITPDERRLLWDLARAFDEIPRVEFVAPEPAPKRAGEKRPGDDFNARGPEWSEILEPHGWQAVYRQGNKIAWRRPGKDRGISATTDWGGHGLFYPFTTSTVFDAERGYSKWRAWAILNHGGDFHAAAKALAELGYGSSPPHLRFVEESTDEDAPESFTLTDTGNAERLTAWHGEDLRYCGLWSKWLAWDGRRWKLDDTAEVERRSKLVSRAIAEEASRVKEDDPASFRALVTWAKTSESHQKRTAMIRWAQSERRIVILPNALDADPWLLTTANGTLDLRTGTLRDHQRDDLLTRMTPATWKPNATCPIFLAFLDRIMTDPITDEPRPEMIAFLQRAIGYSLTGNVSERVMFILHGSGANGKSTFLEVIRALLDDYAMRIPTETLLARRDNSIPNDIARLKGTRFVLASETDEGKRLSEALVKELTGGDVITARFMRGEWFDFKPEFKLWLATNHRPEIRGTDKAIWDRLCLVPFDVSIPEAEQDRRLGEKLLAELPGILRWAVDGCLAWQREGLATPAIVKAATATYRSDMDVLAAWLGDCCEVGGAWSAAAGDLYSSYKSWSEGVGERPMSQKALAQRLIERGFSQNRVHGGRRVWVGLTVSASTSQKFMGQ